MIVVPAADGETHLDLVGDPAALNRLRLVLLRLVRMNARDEADIALPAGERLRQVRFGKVCSSAYACYHAGAGSAVKDGVDIISEPWVRQMAVRVNQFHVGRIPAISGCVH